MDNDKQLINVNDLMDHWMNQLENHQHYKELSNEEIQIIQNNSKELP